MSKILALDPATQMGWAHTTGFSGTWDLSVLRDESSGMRLLRLEAKLNEIKRAAGIDLIAYEAVRAAGGHLNAVIVQSELQGVIKSWADRNGIDYKPFSSSEIKKHATGKGNAGKDLMIKAAVEKFGKTGIDDNEADALWVLDLAVHRLFGGYPCLSCDGKGTTQTGKCIECLGEGRTEEFKTR